MFVIHLENAPDSIRGILSLYCSEPSPYTFVSNASAKIRESLWNIIIDINKISAIMIYNTNNEQGYDMKMFGYPSYEVQSFDGLNLISRPANSQSKTIAEKLWAKLNPYKSLIDHMIEAGITSECLMDNTFNNLLKRLSEVSEIKQDGLKRQIMFLCAIHDIGKIHPVFQCQKRAQELYPDFVDTIEAMGLLQKSLSDSIRHEKYAEQIIPALMKDDADKNSIEIIKRITALHHQKRTKEKPEKIHPLIKDRWYNIQKYVYDFLKTVFQCDTFMFPKLQTREDKFIFSSGILGIMITADWISSNQNVFDDKSYKDFSSIQKCIAYKKQQALVFLMKEHLTKTEFTKPLDFRSMFNLAVPRPVQKDVTGIVENSDLSLLLIESGCGSGKTEAALYAAAQLGWKNKLSGFYMGLPTGASAEAIQNRVDDFMEKIKMDKTRLYTSKAMLFHESDTEPGWTDISSRRMLAHSAVGTVDQVMTVARKVRFESVRMAGLSSKVLIIDELHAYDSFMIETIISLLKICVSLHVPVILLSATLPVKTKRLLFSRVFGKDDIEPGSGYPLITYIDANGNYHEKVSESHEPDRKIKCELLPILKEPDKIAENAIQNIKDGGCECIIMNLIDDAISVYDEIKKKVEDDCIVILYHARMSSDIRDKKTKEILKMFGKDRSERPNKAIVVSTQVLEQSLDIDFDYMMTAIAPVDLIIQRIGRYHRHNDVGTIRERQPIELKVQVFISNNGDYESNEYIYEPCFLSATENKLKKRQNLTIPSGNPDIINAVYKQQDIDSIIHNACSSSDSKAGNIDISKGFSLYDDVNSGEIEGNKYLTVRQLKYKSVNVAVMPETDIKRIGTDRTGTDNDIALYKQYVVSIAKDKIRNFKSFIEKNGVFSDVRIFDENNCYDEGLDNTMVLDDEYGLRIVKI